MESDEQGKGFQVRDRRRFTETGEPRAAEGREEREESAAEGGGASPEAEAPRRDPAETSPEAARPTERDEPVEITMTTFLMSLSTQALVLLGDFPDPATGDSRADLGGAQEIIALIGMLKEKTRGNLDPAETRLIDKILFDLRMRYVEKVRK
ncbi:MAG: DUF1844 domain-containing protein [Candidatus Binatia bacterium]